MTASAELLAEQSSGGRHAVPVRPDLDTWVKVAERLAEADPAKARELLSAVCAIPLQRLEGIPELALAAAADLWARWGDTDRCRQAAEIVLRQDWSHRGILPSPDLRVARTLYHVDPAAAETIVQHGFAQLELEHDLHEADPIGRSLIDLRLSELADVLAGWDVPRALEVARQVSQVGWTRGSDPDHANDRASLLARIAHRLVASDPDQAHGVLEECFGLTLTQIVLGHPQPAAHPGLLYRPVGDGETRPEGSKMGGLANDLAAFGNLREHWRTATGWTLYHEPADIARSVLPPPSAGGSSASWGRTLRTFADRLAADHPQRASRLIDWLADPAEEAIGAARLAVLAHQANRADAPYWWVRTTAALEALPQYACDLNLTATDPGLAFAYLNPRARANGEAAIRLAHWDVPTALSLLAQTGSSYLMLAFRASLLCQAAEVSNRDETQASHLDAAQLLDLHTSVLKEAEGWADPLLTAVTTMRLVVNLATLRPTEAAGLAARVRLPVYRALATVLLAPSTPDPAGTCRDAVAGLPDDTLPHHKTAIAALGTTSLRQVDPAGAAELAETALLIARTANTPLLRARALLELAVRYDGHDLHDPIGLLGDVTDELQQVLEHDRRAELLRLLFVAALVIEPARAPGILAQALELGWSDTMALIEEAAGPLLARCGTDLPERLHDAIGTARACLQDPHRRPAAPPWHIDGVRLEGRSREAVS